MTFLVLQPLSPDLLPAALALDHRCFGGMWTLESYRRELESPNSELLVFVEKAGGRRQAAEGRLRRERSVERRQEAEEGGEAREKGGAEGARERKYLDSTVETQNSKLKTQNSKLSPPTPHTPHPTPLLGLGCYWAILEEAHITMLAIDPLYQHQGLGQALLLALMVSAHGRGLERATLEVRVSNQVAVSLYQKFGFREAGRRRRYYPDNGEDALVLWHGGLQKPEFSQCLTNWQRQVDDRLYREGWQLSMKRDRPVSPSPE